jgi:hypothetical protein
MSLFSFFKKRKPQLSLMLPEEELQHIIDYIPDIYKEERQYIIANDYLSNNELELALENLVKLPEEKGHYFSNEFWNKICSLSNQMHLPNIHGYCLKQIRRNQVDLKSFTPPYGSTAVKFDDTHFQHYYAEKVKEKWIYERHFKDGVDDLLKKDGVYLKMHGIGGTLYFVNQGWLGEAYVEIGTTGLLLTFNNVKHWSLPTKQLLTEPEKQKIKEEISSWALKTKNVIDFDD